MATATALPVPSQPVETAQTDSPAFWRQRFDPERMGDDAIFLEGIISLVDAVFASDHVLEDRFSGTYAVLSRAREACERLNEQLDALRFYCDQQERQPMQPAVPAWMAAYRRLSAPDRAAVDETMAKVVEARDARARAQALRGIEPLTRQWRRETKAFLDGKGGAR